ncbi:MAG: peptidyl-prolyl cis-trans isomerase [Prevotella sp.]|nr:peptidyl-prolyl cis-trans isomerase [Prevotella sp.]
MKKILICLHLFFMVFVAFSCSGSGAADADRALNPIVTVGDKTLYQADLDEVIPMGLSAEDSIAAAKSYIDMWVNDQLIYNKALQNIINKKDIDELVESYKKSLITSSYQEQLLKEYFSKSVSENELKAYYEQNKDKFKLEDNIIKGLYLKIPVNSKQLANFQKWYKQGNDAAIENIEKNTLQNAVAYEYFYDKWVGLVDVLENMPPAVTDEKIFLQRNKNLELRDSSFVYLLNIKEYELAGSEAPYDYVKGQLSEMYMEQKKADYIQQVKKDLYGKAVSDEEIKFYNK